MASEKKVKKSSSRTTEWVSAGSLKSPGTGKQFPRVTKIVDLREDTKALTYYQRLSGDF